MTTAPGSVPFDLETLGAGLVFAQSLPGLLRVLADERVAVVQAPPGTGKTTLVPPAAANLLAQRAAPGAGAGASAEAEAKAPAGGRGTGRAPLRVVVTQPRRVAARAAARRLASLDRPAGTGGPSGPGGTGRAAGARAGHTVRGERTTSRETLVEFVTPGILVNRLLADPGLAGTGAVILDEVHERDLESDLLFGMLGEVAQLRPDLLLVAMSATLDAARFAERLGEGTGRDAPVPVVDCPSALHPVDVSYRPHPGPRQDTRGVTREFLDHVARCAVEAHAAALAAEPGTDALVFVPGAREVTLTCERIAQLAPGTEVLPLHGQLPSAQQDRAVGGREPGGAPRIIVSTSLAESSLTVPGVRLVVDSGLAREPRRDTGRGMMGLVTATCAQSSAEQRAGRAGRLGPGTVVRCYDRSTLGAAPPHPTPAVQVADLTGAALVLACWGAPGGEGLVLPDPLPQDPLAEALATLRALDAIDDAGRATDHGQGLAAIPAEPRLARALLDGTGLVGARAAGEVVALVSSDVRPEGADLTGALSRLRSGGAGRGGGARDGSAARWAQDARRFEALASSAAGPGADAAPERDRSPGARVPGQLAVGAVVGLAWPERLARRVSDPGTGRGTGAEVYLLASGTRAALPPGSALAGTEWLACAEVARAEGRAAAGTGAVIRAAAPVDGDLAQRLAGPLLAEERTAHWQDGRVVGRLRRGIGAITLSETPVTPDRAQGRAAVVRMLRTEGLGPLGVSEAADTLRRRLALVHRVLGEPWPDVSDAALAEDWEAWLAPEVERLAVGARTGSVHLAEALRRLLPWPDAVRLDELVPERLPVPSGRTAAVRYPAVGAGGEDGDSGAPVVAVKLQECFGLAETPRLVDGRVPVVFHLLSPAGRPLAVTGDLASFWSGPYAQVRAEMRGRYPKHPWPEDPWTAPATARTRNRG
ncbi:ATP-dependent helicase HrpB [Micrococcus sp. TA1]|uniref:ATP-dependent helicase HrpB n=1 Tax=Micrococcus sp. TA1 TaxID=681627 RepID=UPI00161F1068|nr:ATP-dependent helicase HrpB [Micrococcus sp. TA1]MBB5747878.1 ATP-dependent helicase HrpB [Micrococcus sp. TA1]